MNSSDLSKEMRPIHQALHDTQSWWYDVVKITPDYNLGQDNLIRQRGMSCEEWDAALRTTVSSAIAARRDRLLQLGLLRGRPTPINEGRFLLFEPGLTMNDGLAEEASDGFFDVHNCPPSDFWLGFVTVFPPYKRADTAPVGVLVSWVPTELQKLASQGIHVIAENCSDWADTGSWKNSTLTESLMKLSGKR